MLEAFKGMTLLHFDHEKVIDNNKQKITARGSVGPALRSRTEERE